MNKEYLPYFESLDEKYKQVYMSWDKETLIDHLVANIHNGQVLLDRIDEAIEYIEQVGIYSDYGDSGIQSENDLLKILKGE